MHPSVIHLLLAGILAAPLCAQNAVPENRLLELAAPIDKWDEAVPLGNGMTGGLLWGGEHTIRLSLDRGDLWDERRPDITQGDDWTWATIRRLVEEQNQAEISRLFDAPYHNAYPTKLPGGRLEISLNPDRRITRFSLDMQQAVGTASLDQGTVDCFFSATEPVALMRLSEKQVTYKFLRPEGLNKLGYEAATFGEQGNASWMVQQAALGLKYAVVVREQNTATGLVLAIAISSTKDGSNPLKIGLERTARALKRGYDSLLTEHQQWWRDFWATSNVCLPDARLQRHYNLVSYFYGAASRIGAPPMPLQAVWARDDGNLPPWKGDFHNDLNTQMTYLAYHTAGHLEAGRSFLEYHWDLLPTYRHFATEFYGVDGAAVPGVATLAGQATGGWSQYSLSPSNGLWIGQTFYLHWKYTMDREFLSERAYPWLAELGTCIAELLQERDGLLYLPLSSSPEIHNNSFAAWLQPNSNYDNDLLHWAFGALDEMARELGRDGQAQKWRLLQSKLPTAHIDQHDVLMFSAGEPFNSSHRHHAHTMAIHPLGTLHVESDAASKRIIDATLDRMHELGTQAWVGYSFSWFSCLLARAGRAEQALQYLRDYERAFLLRNGFHANGDQIGAGLSGFRYRPFTLEGNFLAMEAVHEMLLQSWGGRLRVFPAVADEWQDVSFNRLRAQGGFVVSAVRSKGLTQRVEITATATELLRLVDPFDGADFSANRSLQQTEQELQARMKAGEQLILTRNPPAVAPAEAVAPDAPNRRAVQTLAGEWQMRLDPNDLGETQHWYQAELADGWMHLPGTLDLAGLGHVLDPATMSYPAKFQDSEWPGRGPAQRLDESGHLVRKHMYLGKAWYQREFIVPESWAGLQVSLFLERVMWASRVWLDGRLIGGHDSLVAPHQFDFGSLKVGRHRLTICVDNRLIHPIGIIGHAYGAETQSRWNGIVGRIELLAKPLVALDSVQVFTAADCRSVLAKVRISYPDNFAAKMQLRLALTDPESGLTLASEVFEVDLSSADDRTNTPVGFKAQVECTLAIEGAIQRWSEFDPHRYIIIASLGNDELRVPCGFRHIQRDGRQILVNDQAVFQRSTLDCAVYPLTGHPPMDVDQWLQTLGTIQEYGFNHVRFHSWCPPEAAFEAADQLGIYLAPETPFWVDNWTSRIGLKPGLLGSDPAVTEYVRQEIRRISDTYGNHPSFSHFCIGNEFGMDSDWDVVNQLVAEAKAHDNRHLFNGATARKRLAADDFWVTHRAEGPVRGIGPPHTNWDFSSALASTDLPVISHETGQRPVFPDFEELLPKFLGPLQPHNYARLHKEVIAAGLADQVKDFERASAQFQMVQYKAEHEAMRRTSDLAGYQLLMLNDFTGQSEALVGILDPFWESKGVVEVRDVQQWNAPTVILARFDRYIWTSTQNFTARIDVSHFGQRALTQATVSWSLHGDDFAATGTFAPTDIQPGGSIEIGQISVPLASIETAQMLTLNVNVGEVENRWKVWVYPPSSSAGESGITITSKYDQQTRDHLAAGKSVLLLAHSAQNPYAKRTGFASVYWSAGWWGDAFSALGILCDANHPALQSFPNEGHSDWQWYGLTEGATTFLLDGAPTDFRPIVQPVTDFHHNHLLGQLFETQVGQGKLVVCGYDLNTDLENRHAARQLRASLLDYMASDAFQPQFELPAEFLQRMLASPQLAPIAKLGSATLQQASLHVRAATKLRISNQNLPWKAEFDEALRHQAGYSWQVNAGTWRDPGGTAWHGNPLEITIKLPPDTTGTLYVHVHDWNQLGRRGTITVDDKIYILNAHVGAGKWLAFPIQPQDSVDGLIILSAQATTGPNLMITQIAFVPAK